MTEPNVDLEDVIQLAIVDADLAWLDAPAEMPIAGKNRLAVTAALEYMLFNNLIQITPRGEWPEWCESPPPKGMQ